MSEVLFFLSISAIIVFIAVFVYKRQKTSGRVMPEGKLLKSEVVSLDGERFYVEKVAFKDWHVSIHSYYLISDRLTEGHTIVDQRGAMKISATSPFGSKIAHTLSSDKWMPSP